MAFSPVTALSWGLMSITSSEAPETSGSDVADIWQDPSPPSSMTGGAVWLGGRRRTAEKEA